MLLIHFKLTHQNIVLQEAKKHLPSKRNPEVGGTRGKGLMEIRTCKSSTSPLLPMDLHYGAPVWSSVHCTEYESHIPGLEVVGMQRSASPIFCKPNILEMKPQRGND